ncbi:MAG: hypothetical protein OXF86_10995 [Caldilineaceae bacterium]|nr:hypothetical protein [Caldilineaceae bacterium]
MSEHTEHKSNPEEYTELWESRGKIRQPEGKFQDMFKGMELNQHKSEGSKSSPDSDSSQSEGAEILMSTVKEEHSGERTLKTRTSS